MTPGRLSPIVIASIGSYSGPIGNALLPGLQGAQLWVKAANERGGLAGHVVKLIVYDDGGDPARHRSQVEEAIVRRHAVAFLMNGEVLTGQASVEYITAQRVPVIGVDGGEDWPYSSPMYFPQMSAGNAFAQTYVPSLAAQVLPRGKRRLGTVVCVEAATCADVDRIVAESAAAAGLEHVYRGKASVGQPDFTAECLAARQQGAEILLVVLDQNSVARVGAACARQAYRPIIAFSPTVVEAEQQDDPNLDGAVAFTGVFPYFQTGTRATDEFGAAVRAFGRGLRLGVGLAIGWSAGKMLERAGTALREPPTSDVLLEGLWSFQAETLGGLTYPLTFRRDRPPERRSCWFDLTVRDRRWVSPDRFTIHCLSPPGSTR